MLPSKTWFPSTLQERAAWFKNFSTQFSALATLLGFTAAQVTALTADNAEMQFCAGATVEVDAFAAAFRQYRKSVTEGNTGDPTPNYPINPTATPAGVPTGIFERLDNLVGRIRLSEGYTPEIGAALGILPAQPSAPIPADELQPSLKALAMPGSVVQVSFIRGNTNGVALETRVDNADTWSDAGRFYSSPASLVIPENAQGLPRAVQMRARFIDGNTPVGQFSATISTSTQPAV